MKESIGGYLPLELPRSENNLHSDAIYVNSGRNALLYIVLSNHYKKVYLPYYLCSSLANTLRSHDIAIAFYHVNDKLLPELSEIHSEEAVLVVNYWGMYDDYCHKIQSCYKNAIIDGTQSIYYISNNRGNVFYSLRKYFGVPDGAPLYCDNLLEAELPRDVSWTKMSHLIKSIDLGIEIGYDDFRKNEEYIGSQPLKTISRLSMSIFRSIDVDNIKTIRKRNFNYLESKLRATNRFSYENDSFECPMVYPYMPAKGDLRAVLQRKRIYVPIYWKEVLENIECSRVEKNIAEELIPLPIDQRYSIEDMEIIIDVIKEAEYG